MSTRKTVFDTLITELQAISGIGKVTRDEESWSQTEGKDLPALFVDNPIVERNRMSFHSTSANDMEAVMTVEIKGRVFDYEDSVDTALDTLLDDVETKLVGSTALDAITYDVRPIEDEPDLEVNENTGEFVARYMLGYFYNHLNP